MEKPILVEHLTATGVATLNNVLKVSNDVSFNSNAFIAGDTSMNGRLDVGGDVSLNGDLTIDGNLNVLQQQNTSVINTTVNNYEVIISNDLSINGAIKATSDASFGGNLFVNGTTELTSSATLQDILMVSGDVSLNSDLFVQGDVSVNGTMSIQGTTTVDGDILPTIGNVYNLGSVDKPFHSVYITSNSINFTDAGDNTKATLSINTETGGISVQPKDAAGADVGNANEYLLLVNSNVGLNKLSSVANANMDISGNLHVSSDVSFGTTSDNPWSSIIKQHIRCYWRNEYHRCYNNQWCDIVKQHISSIQGNHP
jgi:hypothetical protein